MYDNLYYERLVGGWAVHLVFAGFGLEGGWLFFNAHDKNMSTGPLDLGQMTL